MTKPRKILQEIVVYAHDKVHPVGLFENHANCISKALELALKQVHGQFYLGGYQKLSISIYDKKPHAEAEHVWSTDSDVLLVDLWPFDFERYNKKGSPKFKRKQLLELTHRGCATACEHLQIDSSPFDAARDYVLETNYRCFEYISKPQFSTGRSMSCRVRVEYGFDIPRWFLEVKDASDNIIKDVCYYFWKPMLVTRGEYREGAIPQRPLDPQWVNNDTAVRLTCEDDPENPYYIEIPVKVNTTDA